MSRWAELFNSQLSPDNNYIPQSFLERNGVPDGVRLAKRTREYCGDRVLINCVRVWRGQDLGTYLYLDDAGTRIPSEVLLKLLVLPFDVWVEY